MPHTHTPHTHTLLLQLTLIMNCVYVCVGECWDGAKGIEVLRVQEQIQAVRSGQEKIWDVVGTIEQITNTLPLLLIGSLDPQVSEQYVCAQAFTLMIIIMLQVSVQQL